jgi:hypothetical protein
MATTNIKNIVYPKPPYDGAPRTTNVIGYYNQFDYPMHLQMPELNRNIMLSAREFITTTLEAQDDSGKPARIKTKVNDPIFENYVGKNKLARETGTPEIPIVWLNRPVLSPIPQHMFEFAGSNKFATDPQSGRVLLPEQVYESQLKQQTGSPASASSISGYTMEQATQAGVIRPRERGLMREDNEKPELPPVRPQQPVLATVPPRQPDAPRPKPALPPAPPVDETIRMPKTPPVPPVPAVALPPTPLTAPPNPQILEVETEPVEDLMSDVPDMPGNVPIEQVNLDQLSSQAAAKFGVAVAVEKPDEVQLPEPNLNSPAPTAPAPLAEQAGAPVPPVPRKIRRRRGEQPAGPQPAGPQVAAPVAPVVPPPAA